MEGMGEKMEWGVRREGQRGDRGDRRGDGIEIRLG